LPVLVPFRVLQVLVPFRVLLGLVPFRVRQELVPLRVLLGLVVPLRVWQILVVSLLLRWVVCCRSVVVVTWCLVVGRLTVQWIRDLWRMWG